MGRYLLTHGVHNLMRSRTLSTLQSMQFKLYRTPRLSIVHTIRFENLNVLWIIWPRQWRRPFEIIRIRHYCHHRMVHKLKVRHWVIWLMWLSIGSGLVFRSWCGYWVSQLWLVLRGRLGDIERRCGKMKYRHCLVYMGMRSIRWYDRVFIKLKLFDCDGSDNRLMIHLHWWWNWDYAHRAWPIFDQQWYYYPSQPRINSAPRGCTTASC